MNERIVPARLVGSSGSKQHRRIKRSRFTRRTIFPNTTTQKNDNFPETLFAVFDVLLIVFSAGFINVNSIYFLASCIDIVASKLSKCVKSAIQRYFCLYLCAGTSSRCCCYAFSNRFSTSSAIHAATLHILCYSSATIHAAIHDATSYDL